MLDIRLTPQAHQDIENIYNYISKDGKNIAFQQINLIFKSLDNLKVFPKMGKDIRNYLNVKKKYRSLYIGKSYIAFYRIEQDYIMIIRILWTNQDYISLLELE